MSDAVTVTRVGQWKAGYDHKNKMAILIFEFSDKGPAAFAIPMHEASKIGRALLELDTEGMPSPARPN